MQMPGRKFSANESYRYGFNGKENDNDVKGEGNQQDYGMRIYDPRLGRFLSVDPISSEFPWNSTYAFAENDPINFIDLDGLERASPPRSGGGRAGRTIPYWQFQAQGAGRALQRGLTQRAFNAKVTHANNMRNNGNYRARHNLFENLVQNQRTDNYWTNAFNAASLSLAGGGVRDNNKIGDTWDKFVHASMLKNKDYIGVARQVSLKVTGMVNGQMTVAKIRMDNVGVKLDPVTGKVLFDFKEAKYSIQEITINNVIQTLTPQQNLATNILVNGSNVEVFIRGNGSTKAMNAAMYGTSQRVVNGENITGQIGEINIVVPPSNQQGNSANSKPAQTSPTTNNNSSNGN